MRESRTLRTPRTVVLYLLVGVYQISFEKDDCRKHLFLHHIKPLLKIEELICITNGASNSQIGILMFPLSAGGEDGSHVRLRLLLTGVYLPALIKLTA